MKTRVKVKRSELLKIVDGRLRKAEREHERAVAAYPEQLEKYKQRAVVTLSKALKKARTGTIPIGRYNEPGVSIGSMPMKPSDNGRELCNLRRLKKTLEIGADETIVLSQEDADAYFGPCNL